jgi:hypothetical protein
MLLVHLLMLQPCRVLESGCRTCRHGTSYSLKKKKKKHSREKVKSYNYGILGQAIAMILLVVCNIFRVLTSEPTAKIKIHYSKMYHLHEQWQPIIHTTLSTTCPPLFDVVCTVHHPTTCIYEGWIQSSGNTVVTWRMCARWHYCRLYLIEEVQLQ